MTYLMGFGGHGRDQLTKIVLSVTQIRDYVQLERKDQWNFLPINSNPVEFDSINKLDKFGQFLVRIVKFCSQDGFYGDPNRPS